MARAMRAAAANQIMMLAVNPLSSVCTNVHRDQYCTTRIELLVILSFTHFYGRAAAELSFSDLVLRTFTRLLGAVSRFYAQLSFGTGSDHSVCVTDVPAATATSSGQRSLASVGLLAMAASIQFHPLEVPRYLTEIHIVLPLHIYMAMRTSTLRLFASATRPS